MLSHCPFIEFLQRNPFVFMIQLKKEHFFFAGFVLKYPNRITGVSKQELAAPGTPGKAEVYSDHRVEKRIDKTCCNKIWPTINSNAGRRIFPQSLAVWDRVLL